MISIIIPIYNSDSYLLDCLQSIENQTFSNFEVICVDDGSTDKSRNICLSFNRKDSRFKYIFQENGGVSKARNTGINNAEGEYICFIDSDDVIDTDFLYNLFMNSHDSDLVICDYTRDLKFMGNKENQKYEYYSKTYIKDVIYERIKHPNIWTMLFKSDIIYRNNLRFVEGCVRKEDSEFYLKYMAHCTTVVCIDYIGYYYRDNLTSAMNNYNNKSLTGIEAAIRIKDYLVAMNIIDDKCTVVEAAIQEFVYHLSRRNNVEIYDKIHNKYNVRNIMKNLLNFPRLSRRIVALVYLILGKKVFLKTLSSVFPE